METEQNLKVEVFNARKRIAYFVIPLVNAVNLQTITTLYPDWVKVKTSNVNVKGMATTYLRSEYELPSNIY